MLQPLLEQADDVLVVERVKHPAAGAAPAHEPHAAQQPELMRHGRVAQADDLRDLADAPLGPRDRVEDAHARGVAEDLERLGQRVG